MNQDRSMRVEEYVDGVMSHEEHAAFEAELHRSPDLRARVEACQRIDGSLRRLFEPPAAIPAPGAAKTRGRFPFARVLGLAAAVLVLVSVGAVIMSRLGARVDPGRLTAIEAIYLRLSDRGFVPDWKCENDAEFAQVGRDRWQQAMLVKDLPEGVEVLGWAYSGAGGHFVMSRDEMLLLVRHGGRRIMAVVDRVEHARGATLSGLMRPELRVFEGRIGDLAVYELTPDPEPVIVDHLSNPDAG